MSNPRASTAVAVAPTGWWGLADAADWYPEDLPEDWRLGYFANAHSSLYIPSEVWRDLPLETLQSWHEDVHRGFGFFLEAPPTPGGLPATAAQTLGANLVAWLRWDDGSTGRGRLLPAVACNDADSPLGQALRCPPELLGDLRGGARWLRRQVAAAAATLVVLDRPSAAQLEAWCSLVPLLGLADLCPGYHDHNDKPRPRDLCRAALVEDFDP